jgi:CRP-like cAMP-binding protein
MRAEPGARDAFAGVLALKAVPALSAAHPDDLIALAQRAGERRFAQGERLAPAGGAPSLFCVVEGRVRARAGEAGSVAHEAPALAGLLDVLSGEPAALVAESEAVALEIDRPALLEVLEEEFELWVAVLRESCRSALAAGAPAGWEPAAPALPPSNAADLAERMLLLRRVVPFSCLPAVLLGTLAAELEPVQAPDGRLLGEVGDSATGALLVLSGRVGVEPIRAGAAPSFGSGALAGLVETLAGGSHRFRLRASGPVEALRLDGEALVDALEDDAPSAIELLVALARHLRGGTR